LAARASGSAGAGAAWVACEPRGGFRWQLGACRRSSIRTAEGAREQERAGAGVDAARAGGVTLTPERYAGSKWQLGAVQGGASRGGSARRRRTAAPEWMRRQVLARRGGACRSGRHAARWSASAGARGLDLGRRAVRHQALERRIGARGGVAARGDGSTEVRGGS
jgi:hypothetical protein